MNSHFILVPMGRLMFLGILRIPDVWYPNIHRFNSYSFDFAKVLARLPSIGFSIPFFVHAEDSLSSVFNFVLSTCCTWSPFFVSDFLYRLLLNSFFSRGVVSSTVDGSSHHRFCQKLLSGFYSVSNSPHQND